MKRRPKPIRVKIRRALWTIIFEKPPGTQDLYGRCFHNQKTIYARPDKELRGTILHEIVHAAIPWASEEEVCDLERAISVTLEKLP
jgi:hypothetical protein